MFKKALILISSCLVWKAGISQNDLVVKLDKQQGTYPFGSRRSFGTFQDNLNGFKLDTIDYSIYGVWKFSFDQMQTMFNSYLKSGGTDSNFLRRQKVDRWDVSIFPKAPFENPIYVFVGIDKSNHYKIILDQNNNKDFTDDKILTYYNHKPPKDSLEFIEHNIPVSDIKLKIWDGNKYIVRNLYAKFILKQYFGSFKTRFGNHRADTLLMVEEIQEHYQGEFNIHGSPFKLYVHEGTLSARLNNLSDLRFYVAGANEVMS